MRVFGRFFVGYIFIGEVEFFMSLDLVFVNFNDIWIFMDRYREWFVDVNMMEINIIIIVDVLWLGLGWCYS